MEFSIILPVYNVAAYLPRCLESIASQPLPVSEYEIIAVDDGSTDASAELLRRYQKTIPNLSIITQVNQGPSVARNTGIDYARGRYLMCIDPDDWIAPGSLAELYEQVRHREEEIIGFGYCKINEREETTPYHSQPFVRNKVFTGAGFLQAHNIIGVVWGYLFSMDLIRRNGLRMIPGIFHQDEEFVTRAFFHARSVILLDTFVYYYFKRSNSTVNRPDPAHRERLIRDTLTVIGSLASLAADSEDASAILLRKNTFLTLDVIRLLIREGHQKAFIREVLSTLQRLGLYPLAKESYGLKYDIFRRTVSSPRKVIALASVKPCYFPVKKMI